MFAAGDSLWSWHARNEPEGASALLLGSDPSDLLTAGCDNDALASEGCPLDSRGAISAAAKAAAAALARVIRRVA